VANKTVPRRSRRSHLGRPFGDVAFVVGKEEDGLHILRQRTQDAPLEAGIVKPLAEGRPISGEVISLNRRNDVPYLFDVKTELDVSPPKGSAEAESEEQPTGHGPAQVATEAYRKGWDAIWGGRRTQASRLN
jgi:hypothetical protein